MKTKFDIHLPKTHMQGFLVVGGTDTLKIKNWTKTWKDAIVTGILCNGVVLKKMLWYHLYICGIGKKAYQFLLDDNIVGTHLLATNPKINSFRTIFSIRL